MKKSIGLMLLLPALAQAQIYRCDTPQGPVFSDERCGSEAQVVELREETTGLGGGPSEEVRAYLDQKREERADKRQNAPPPFAKNQAEPVEVQTQPPVVYGVNRPYPGRRPARPIERPRPSRPETTPPPEEAGSASVLRPNKEDGN